MQELQNQNHSNAPYYYQGTLNIDFTGANSSTNGSNEQTRLTQALKHIGWKHVETSAFRIETGDLSLIWKGMELVAKQSQFIGRLSALTIHIQGSYNLHQSKANSTGIGELNAFETIVKRAFPGLDQEAS